MHNGAFDLPFQLLRVDDLADIVSADDFEQLHLTRLDINFHFDCFRHVTVSEIGFGAAGLGIEGSGCRRMIHVLAFGRALFFIPILPGRFRRRRGWRCRT